MLRCWHLVWILVRTDHPCLGVGCHSEEAWCDGDTRDPVISGSGREEQARDVGVGRPGKNEVGRAHMNSGIWLLIESISN
jgi:hypothetical protein